LQSAEKKITIFISVGILEHSPLTPCIIDQDCF